MNTPKIAMRMLGEQATGITNMILLLIEDYLRLTTLIPEVFLHTRFGQRYLSVEIAIVVSTLCAAMILIPSPFFKLLGGLFPVLAAVHLIAAALRARRGIHIHSRYTGEPHFFWWYLRRWVPIDEIVVKRWLEPGLLLILAFIMHYVDPVFAPFLAGCGVSLAIRVSLEYRRWRERLLDMLDAQLEAELMNESIKQGQDSRDVRGCPTVGAFAGNGEAREVLARALNSVESSAAENPAATSPADTQANQEPSAGGDAHEQAKEPEHVPGWSGLDPALQAFLESAKSATTTGENAEREAQRAANSPSANGRGGHDAETAIEPAIARNGKGHQKMIHRCPACRKKIGFRSNHAGREVLCPNPECRQRLALPAKADGDDGHA